MKEMKIDQGERVDILINDTDSVSAQILVAKDMTQAPIIVKDAPFTDGSAQITLLFAETNQEPDEYIYQIRLYDAEGEYIVLDGDCSTGDCSVSPFIICPVIPEGS